MTMSHHATTTTIATADAHHLALPAPHRELLDRGPVHATPAHTPPAHASQVHVARPGCHHSGALGLSQYLTFVQAVAGAATDRFAHRRPGRPVYIVTPAMIHALVIGHPWCRSCPPDELEGRAAAVYALGSE